VSAWGELDATALRDATAAGERSARRNVEECFAAIEALDPDLHVFLSTEREAALLRADDLDAALKSGGVAGPLHGVPVALKANMCLEGHESSCGSRILEGWRAPYTATFV
jgi:aspartyl-tRNA(Asn)/glutamyl-tRNA(Gln) amidotransferase subunit A